jgi:hypothetical protein
MPNMQERRKAERRRPQDVNDRDLAGQFCRTSDGQRVFVESVRATALYQYIEGPRKGQGGNCLPSSLELLGRVIPV